MKKQFLFFLSFLPLPLFAQVTNVRAGQSGQDIVITYDLAESAEVRAYMSVGGQPFVELYSAQGDVGCVPQGTKRTITWSPLVESEEFVADNVVFRVEALEAPHAFVDLGLPSGTLWATCNVGANRSVEFGGSFAWGETQSKRLNAGCVACNYYKFYSSSEEIYTKYNTDDAYGIVDNKIILDTVDDAATANWGGKWRTPTDDDWKELEENCTWTWTTRNKVSGCKVTAANGNFIFLPATSNYYRTTYWSSSLGCQFSSSSSALGKVMYFQFYNGSFSYGRSSAGRCWPYSVRPVYKK